MRELRSRSDAEAQLDGSVWPGEGYECGEDVEGMGGGRRCMNAEREGGRYRSSCCGGPPEEPGGR